MTKAFVVNLDRSTYRRDFMATQLQKHGIEYEFVSAFDARRLDARDMTSVNANSIRGGPMRPGEIACTRSHADACVALAKQAEHQFGIILEDDIVIGQALAAVIKQLERIQSDGDVTLLSTSVFRHVDLKMESRLGSAHELRVPDPLADTWGTLGYFLSKTTAQRLQEAMLPVRARADDWLSYVQSGAIKRVFVVFPFPILHAEFNTDVKKFDAQSAAFNRGGISLFIHTNRIFPAYQFALLIRRWHAEKRQRRNLTLDGKAIGRTYSL